MPHPDQDQTQDLFSRDELRELHQKPERVRLRAVLRALGSEATSRELAAVMLRLELWADEELETLLKDGAERRVGRVLRDLRSGRVRK